MARIGSFTSRPEAEIAASMLQAHDVAATVVGDDAGGVGGLNLGAADYRVEVADAQRVEAEDLLDVGDPPRGTGAGSDRTWEAHVVGLLLLAVVLAAVVFSVFV